MDDVIFLLASERSGSNLISRIFGAHPDICAPGPAHLFRVFGQNANRYGPTDTEWPAFLTDLKDLFSAKVSRWSIDGTELDIPDLGKSRDLAETILEIYRKEAKASGKTVLFIKENQLFSYLPFVLGLAARMRFIYLVRDPRDMAVSWQNSKLARGGIIRAAKTWASDQTGFSKALETVSSDHLTASLAYEDLISAPEPTLRRVCGLLQVDFKPSMLEFHESAEAVANSKASADWRNTGLPLMRNNSGKYKTELNADQIAYIEAICQIQMATLDCKTDTDPQAPFGQFNSLAELEGDLKASEPWYKPGFDMVPDQEKQQRKTWSDILNRIQLRPVIS